MKRQLLAGFAAGAGSAFWLAAFSTVFASQYWMPLPLLGGIIPFALAMLAGHPLLLPRLLPAALLDRFGRVLPLALSLLLPALCTALYLLGNSFAFVSGSADAMSLLVLMLLAALTAGVQLDALAVASGKRSGQVAPLLVGAGAGVALLALSADALPLPLLFVLFIGSQALPLLPLRPDREGAAAAAPAGKGNKRGIVRFASGWRFILPGVLFVLTAYAGLLLRAVSEMPGATGNGLVMHAGLLLLALGAGTHAGRMRAVRDSALLAPLFAAGGAAVMIVALWLWVDGGFAALYIAWYAGAGLGYWPWMFPLLLLHVPVAACAAALEAGRDARDVAPAAWGVPAALYAGLILYAFIMDAGLWEIAVRVAAGAVLLLGLWQLLRVYRTAGQPLLAAALLLAGVITLAIAPWMGFTGFLDPMRFRETAVRELPSGKLALLHSRDYDDPFYAVQWRESNSLTQSSRVVQTDLYRMGHVPMLLAPEQARVLVLGLGSTLPLQAVHMHAPKSVDCVDPSGPFIMLAAETKKDKRPRAFLQKTTFHAERLESYVRRSGATYDAIILAEPFAQTQPSPFALMPGTLRAAADRLSDDGVLMVWLPLARVGVDGVRMLAAAMGQALPHIELWISSPDPESAMAGIAGYRRMPSELRPSEARFDAVRQNREVEFHFRYIEFDRYSAVAAMYGMDNAALRRWSADATAPSMFAPLELHDVSSAPERSWEHTRAMLEARTEPTPLLAAMSDSVRTLTRRMLADRPRVYAARVTALRGDDRGAAEQLAAVLRENLAFAEARRAMADILLRQAAGAVGAQQYPTAIAMLNQSMALVPLNTYLLRLLMISAFNTGDREASALAIDGIRKLDPLHAGYRDNQGTIRAQQGAVNDALLLYENAITIDQLNEEFYCNLASYHYSSGRVWEAVRTLGQARERAFYPAKALYLQGMFYAEQGRVDLAREAWEEYFRVATPLDPAMQDVRTRLAQLPPSR